MDVYEFLREIQQFPCVSGREFPLSEYLTKKFKDQFDETTTDAAGNCILIKKAKKKDLPVVMMEAHLDEVGVVVKEILENGFVSIEESGGIDASILPGTEFVLFGKKPCRAVTAQKPPHLMSEKDRKAKPQIDQIYLDTGFSTKEETSRYLAVGDVGHYAAPVRKMRNAVIARGLDNKASVAATLMAAERITGDACELIVLLSSGEESTGIGVKSAALKYKPDFALVTDVGFAVTPGVDASKCIEAGKGPSVSVTDTLSRKMSLWVLERAKENGLPCQVVCEPGGTGTNATALQIRSGGIPCAVISIPLKNMHTPSETVLIPDIEKTADLLTTLAAKPDFPFGEVNELEAK